MEYTIKLIESKQISSNIKLFRFTKPSSLNLSPGLAAILSLPQSGCKPAPYTITSASSDNYIEFMIKEYPGTLSEKIHALKRGDEITLSGLITSLRYSGPGVFIVGGIAITPVLSAVRAFKDDIKHSSLIYSVSKKEDIISENELRAAFGENLIITITQENVNGYEHRKVDEQFIKEKIHDFSKPFYIKGQESFVSQIKEIASRLKLENQNIFKPAVLN